MDHFDNLDRRLRRQFVLVNGGCISGKWLTRGEPVEVNNVSITNTTAQKPAMGLF